MALDCICGEDATLVYVYECRQCGTVIVTHHDDSKCLEVWDCPVCKPVDDFYWKYYTMEQIQKDQKVHNQVDLYRHLGRIFSDQQPKGSLEIYGGREKA